MPEITSMRRRDDREDEANRPIQSASFLRLVTADDPPEPGASTPALDPVELLLEGMRSAATRSSYAADYRLFFGEDYTAATVIAWAEQSAHALAADLQKFKNQQLNKGLSEATVNRRLASMRSLLAHCSRLGISETDGSGLVKSERVIAYRDTRGVSLKLMKKLLSLPDLATEKGKRDAFIFRLAFEHGLRCAEIITLNMADISYGEKRIRIRGKGKGSQLVKIDVSVKLLAALKDYLQETKRWRSSGKAVGPTGTGPLLLSCHHNPEHHHQRLTDNGLYEVVIAYGQQIGIRVSPHKLRHSAITHALRVTNGNLVKAQDFSRHKDPRTLQIYNDQRNTAQAEVTQKISRDL